MQQWCALWNRRGLSFSHVPNNTAHELAPWVVTESREDDKEHSPLPYWSEHRGSVVLVRAERLSGPDQGRETQWPLSG